MAGGSAGACAAGGAVAGATGMDEKNWGGSLQWATLPVLKQEGIDLSRDI